MATGVAQLQARWPKTGQGMARWVQCSSTSRTWVLEAVSIEHGNSPADFADSQQSSLCCIEAIAVCMSIVSQVAPVSSGQVLSIVDSAG